MCESTEDRSGGRGECGGRGEWGGSVIVGYSVLCADLNSIVPHEAVSLNNMEKTKTVFPIPGFLLIQTLKYMLDTTTSHFPGLELSSVHPVQVLVGSRTPR